jgi:glycosyltransferase involved in cell wall biosynthesis
MKRVLLVKDGLGVGGSERQLVMLARGLAARDHAIDVVNLAGATSLESELNSAHVPVTRITRRHKFDVRPILQLAQHVRASRPDVVHSFHWLANLYATIALQMVPIHYRPTLVVSLRSHYYLGRKGALRAALDRVCAPRASVVVANCQVLLEHALTHRLRYRRSVVVYNGVHVPPRASARADGEVRFVAVGRLTAVKRQRDILMAARAVVADRPNARFWFVGDGPDRAELERTAVRFGLGDRVCFAGEVAHVEPMLLASDALVLASEHEGMPNAILEGMAAGLPVVATCVGGVGEAVTQGETGVLVPPREPGVLADALVELTRDAGARAQMGTRAHQVASERFSEPAMLAAYERLYAQVAGWT